MIKRILSLLGLCRRAGKLTMGNDAVIDDILRGKARLVVLANDISKNTQKGILSASHQHNIKVFVIDADKFMLSEAVGKYCAVMSVTDAGFAKKLISLIESTQKNSDDDMVETDTEKEE